MLAIWIAGALLLGLAVARIGLPPLVGFLASGFVFAALGMERTPLLADLAHAGVLLLLFAVGLKLRIKTLLRYEVWGTAIAHLAAHGRHRRRSCSSLGAGLSPALAFALAVAFGFSSTVLAAKVLDGNRELRAVHGRVAIGILIVQDVVAVVLLAVRQRRDAVAVRVAAAARAARAPGDRLVARALRPRRAAGAVRRRARASAAARRSRRFGLSAELGALLLGTMLADHRRSQELTNVLWGLKELFLVGFFLNIGFSGPPTWEARRRRAVARRCCCRCRARCSSCC